MNSIAHSGLIVFKEIIQSSATIGSELQKDGGRHSFFLSISTVEYPNVRLNSSFMVIS